MQSNSNFLQSKEWQKFQAAVGRQVFNIEDNIIIKHELPLVGNYFYIPRGPEKFSKEILDLAKKENVGWIRFDPRNENVLETIKKDISQKIVKAPHDMQPREIFVIDISKSEEELLSEMKPKTRYNISLAAKKSVKIASVKENRYIEEFLRLTKEMAERQGIKTHPEKYYRKMIEVLPEDMLKIYIAEYENKVIAANLILFYGDMATYLHGASGNEHRNVMAPYLLQWQAILNAKKAGCKFYDFGGIKTGDKRQETKDKNWQGITKFKLGFSPNTLPVVFPGSYDIIINPGKYWVYKILQKIKSYV